MADIEFVRLDSGEMNAHILMKGIMADFRRVEVASIKTTTHFTSPDAKRVFVRYFNTVQLNDHYVSVIASTQLSATDIERAEAKLNEKMESVTAELNKAIDEAEALFKSHGITKVATTHTVPMEITVGIISSTGRRFLELLIKYDQLMPLIQTLEINNVVTQAEARKWRNGIKRSIRSFARNCRDQSLEMKRRIYVYRAREAAREKQAASSAASTKKSKTNPSSPAIKKVAVAEPVPLEQSDPLKRSS
jgi:hypothetical protein